MQEVRECVDRIDPTNLKVLKNLSQLDLLMRVRELSIETGMDALTIFLIGSLPETVDKTAYAKAAELALLGATSERSPVAHVASDLNELVSITCDVVDGSDVVANKPGELATYRVTVNNAQGQPLSGIKVHWRASWAALKQVRPTQMERFWSSIPRARSWAPIRPCIGWICLSRATPHLSTSPSTAKR